MLTSGTVVDQSYMILQLVGEGGNGAVYRAMDIELRREIAIKFLHVGILTSAESTERFAREGRLLSNIHHPNVATLYKAGTDQNSVPYIAMEFIKGRSLQSIVNEGNVSWQRASGYGIQMCLALAEIHSAGVVHRDIKPANFMLAENEVVKLVDFGLARSKNTETLTDTGMLVGTLQYMSPEACQGKRADHRSDIYALGCTLYTMIYGAPPFESDSPIGVLHLHANQPPSFFREGIEIPNSLVSILRKCLSKQPEDRYQRTAELADDLDAALHRSGPLLTRSCRVVISPGRSFVGNGRHLLYLLPFVLSLVLSMMVPVIAARAIVVSAFLVPPLLRLNYMLDAARAASAMRLQQHSAEIFEQAKTFAEAGDPLLAARYCNQLGTYALARKNYAAARAEAFLAFGLIAKVDCDSPKKLDSKQLEIIIGDSCNLLRPSLHRDSFGPDQLDGTVKSIDFICKNRQCDGAGLPLYILNAESLKETSRHLDYAFSLRDIADAYARTFRPNEAFPYYQRALHELPATGDTDLRCDLLLKLADENEELGNFSAALAQNQRCQETAQSTSLNFFTAMALIGQMRNLALLTRTHECSLKMQSFEKFVSKLSAKEKADIRLLRVMTTASTFLNRLSAERCYYWSSTCILCCQSKINLFQTDAQFFDPWGTFT